MQSFLQVCSRAVPSCSPACEWCADWSWRGGEGRGTLGPGGMKEQIPRAGDAAAHDQASAAPVTFTRAGIGYGLKKTIPLELGGVVWGMIFGVVAANVGWAAGEAVVMSALV